MSYADSQMSYVLYAWFGKDHTPSENRWEDRSPPDMPKALRTFDELAMFGVSLWKPEGRPVFLWAVDYITCTDERWVVFGPFSSKEDAKEAFAELSAKNEMSGYRILPEHCARVNMPRWDGSPALPNAMWTDG